MNQFSIRIELHDATLETYAELHAGLRKFGFQKYIIESSGATHQLPNGLYTFSGNYSVDQVHFLAAYVANTIGSNFEIVVDQSVARVWSGLKTTYPPVLTGNARDLLHKLLS